MTKRFEITITADAPDDLFEQGAILSDAYPALTQLLEALRIRCANVSHDTKVLPMRKAKIVPGNPGGAPSADTVIATGQPPAETHAVPGSPHRVRTVARDGEAA